MGNSIDAFEIGARQLPDVLIDRRDPAVLVSPEGAILIELGVDPDHLMTGRLHPVDEDAPDVAPMPSYQDAHLFTPTFSRGPGPRSRVPRATASPEVCPCTARTSYDDRPRADPPRRAVPWGRAPNLSRRRGYIRRYPALGQRTHRLSIHRHPPASHGNPSRAPYQARDNRSGLADELWLRWQACHGIGEMQGDYQGQHLTSRRTRSA